MRTERTKANRNSAEIASEEERVTLFASPEDAKGVYANLAMIKHSDREFVFDFILRVEERAQLVARVISSPDHARDFLEALRSNIEKFDRKKSEEQVQRPSGKKGVRKRTRK